MVTTPYTAQSAGESYALQAKDSGSSRKECADELQTLIGLSRSQAYKICAKVYGKAKRNRVPKTVDGKLNLASFVEAQLLKAAEEDNTELMLKWARLLVPMRTEVNPILDTDDETIDETTA